MAAEAHMVGNAYACPRCGCKDWRGENGSFVSETRHPSNQQVTIRKRICRHCGQTGFTTGEAVIPEGHKLQIVPDEEEEECAA